MARRSLKPKVPKQPAKSGGKVILSEAPAAQAAAVVAKPDESGGKVSWSEGWAAFRLLWNEYTWVTRGATLILIVVSFLSITEKLECITEPACIPAGLMTALTSNGMFSVWTLIIALCVGIHLKIQQERGLLDGAKHYTIGRALAYGYFSNFLIPALLHIKKQSDERKLVGENRLKLRVIFPSTVEELDEFRNTIELDLRAKTKNQSIENIHGKATQTLRRNVLVLTTAANETQAAQDFYLDFPTTLYTVQDYFATWNIWLKEEKLPAITDKELARLQEKHIRDFFKHLDDLSRSETGLKSLGTLSKDLTKKGLSTLFNNYFTRIAPAEIREKLTELARQPKS